MEQQSGGGNEWNTRMEAPAPKPGQMMLWAMQSMAHGADFVSFSMANQRDGFENLLAWDSGLRQPG